MHHEVAGMGSLCLKIVIMVMASGVKFDYTYRPSGLCIALTAISYEYVLSVRAWEKLSVSGIQAKRFGGSEEKDTLTWSSNR